MLAGERNSLKASLLIQDAMERERLERPEIWVNDCRNEMPKSSGWSGSHDLSQQPRELDFEEEASHFLRQEDNGNPREYGQREACRYLGTG